MDLNGVEYYYIRNGQGDVIGLFDKTGIQVVYYIYDAWGKLLYNTGSLASTVGVKNEYRYRGYRYDTETGLYYLQSRYYSPDWDRFINADAIVGQVGELLGHNMFAYCKNNAVNMSDLDGYAPKVNNERPLNDDFLKRPDGSYIDGKELDDLYRNEKNSARKGKIRTQQKIFGQRDKNKRAEKFSLLGKSALKGAGVVGTTYIVYRAVRFIPSLIPIFWWTIPANAIAP